MSTVTSQQTAKTITTQDGTELYYKDWGSGPVVTFSHGWPLSADAWDGQMLFLAQQDTASSRTTARSRSIKPVLQRQRHERVRR